MDSKKLYEKPVPREEAKRLEQMISYPNKISLELLPKNLADQTVIDIGAGPSTDLSKAIQSRGGNYLAMDINEELLRRRTDNMRVVADIRQLPLKDKSVDVVHTRFVLMHLNREDRQKAVKELSRVAKSAIILDYDWSSWEPTNELQKTFIDKARELGTLLGVEMDMGSIGDQEAAQVLDTDVSMKRFHREAGDYYEEMIQMGTAMSHILKSIGEEEKAKDFEKVLREITALKDGDKTPFSPPDIVSTQF